MSSIDAGEWMPRVTAIVPCYNSEAFLERTLNSLAAQTWRNLEILIGDDASTDATLKIAQDFVDRHENARLIKRDANLGWLRNSNDLMAKAAGEFMFFAFHDDLVVPDYVEKLTTALRERPQAILAFSDLEVTELDGTTHIRVFDKLSGIKGSLTRALIMARQPHYWSAPNRGVFRAAAFRCIGGIKPNGCGEYSADWTWLLHMAILGEFVRVPQVLCYKFYKKGSLSKIWPHDEAQRRALWWAGVREILGSPLSLVSKIIVIAYFIQVRTPRRWMSVLIPRSTKRRLKQQLRF